MEHIEIDHIDVSDTSISVNYWLSGNNNQQVLMFKTVDFEDWLLTRKHISIQKYWDHLDSSIQDELTLRIFHDDMKHYLDYRTEMIRHSIETPEVSYINRKPMTKVTSSKRKSAGSESA
jgi:hypothetical protein